MQGTRERGHVKVEDDAWLGGLEFTAGDVVTFVDGPHRFVGVSDSIRGADASLDIVRGEGPAVLEEVGLMQRYGGDEENPIIDLDRRECRARVEVPVRARATVAEIGLDLTFDAVAAPPMSNVLTQVWVGGTVPADAATLPDPPDGAKSAVLTALFEGGELTRFRLSWGTDAPEILEMNPDDTSVHE